MADSPKSETAKREEEVLKFWKENRIFEKTLEKEAPKGEFVFYDGPPFATGTPHSGSLLSSVSKDVMPRYKTMRGFRVRRRWGWDTHGLPIESLVEKKLGLKNKKEILAVGIKTFNETARAMVLEYVHEWKRYVERVGRWVDFDNSYKTMDASYTESVWWALKKIHEKGHLYEGRKVLMYCTHCETPLAKAEIAMDETYKDITEETATVKLESATESNTFFMAWTTTPWTLPGNVALAVGPDIEYVKVKKDGEVLILAKERLEAVLGSGAHNVIETVKGSALLGMAYKPLYEIEKVRANGSQKKWTVLPADFVTTEDGTGIVHTAVIYGEDDYQLGLRENLPMVPLLNPNGTYNDDAPEFVRGQYIKKAEALIKADLESRGLLFSKAPHTHRYPHCYRCGTPLIYNAVSSWFINIQAVKEKLIAENEKITWVPEHLKHGRFKKILETAPDWTISRNRFWASPLPIWKDKAGNVTVVGSLEELKRLTKKSGNRYFLMRHGEADSNVARRISGNVDDPVHLTEKGRADVRASASALPEKFFDLVVVSPFMRTKETAEIVLETLKINPSALVIEPRIREYNHGIFNSSYLEDWYKDARAPKKMERFEKAPPEGETSLDAMRRMSEVLYELEKEHSNKRILIVSHGDPLWLLIGATRGYSRKQMLDYEEEIYPQRAVITELPFIPLPHNDNYELDYHLPYIDEVELVNEKGDKLTRIPEVVDCWVESGSMPFAEYHYPFENKAEFEKRAPGDFVSEYIGQTRAWFYYMHAMSVELFGRQSFRNVITTGNINAADGQKLSKSKKNYTDPYSIFDQYGADAFRYYLMSSVVMQAEDLQFKDDEVKEAHAKVVNMLRNTHAFYALYKDEAGEARADSPRILDRWIVARLQGLLLQVTYEFDRYDVIRASRPLKDFLEDFSTWYVRRSRDRVKGEDMEDKAHALSTMRYVLLTFSKLAAPVMPFVSEEVYQGVKTQGGPESVHLCMWPDVEEDIVSRAMQYLGIILPWHKSPVMQLLAEMGEVRRLVSLALEKRSAAAVQVRQPLSELRIKSALLKGKTELCDLIADEVNVKSVVIDANLSEDVVLNTEITPELKEEGRARSMLRFIQDLRKQNGFMPKDKAVLVVDEASRVFVETHWGALSRVANLERFEVGEPAQELAADGVSFRIDVRRA
jgi:isoleucyl-tRNA synthetase